MGVQCCEQRFRREPAAIILACNPSRKVRYKNGIEGSLPALQFLGADVRTKRPGHLHGKPNSVETGCECFVNKLPYLQRFFAWIQRARLPPLLATPKPEPSTRAFITHIYPALFQSAGQFIACLIVCDINKLF